MHHDFPYTVSVVAAVCDSVRRWVVVVARRGNDAGVKRERSGAERMRGGERKERLSLTDAHKVDSGNVILRKSDVST